MFCLCPVPAKVAGEGRGELDSRVSVGRLEKVTSFKCAHLDIQISIWSTVLRFGVELLKPAPLSGILLHRNLVDDSRVSQDFGLDTRVVMSGSTF